MSMLMPVERCLILIVRGPQWLKMDGLNHMVVGANGYIHNKETKEYVGKNRHLDSGPSVVMGSGGIMYFFN